MPGFAFLASIIAIFSGAQMFTLGIFGEYLARMYGRTMERPAYVVDERSEREAGTEERAAGRNGELRLRNALHSHDALQLDYFPRPWDTKILGVSVAQISELR